MFSLSTTLWGDVSLFFVWIIDVVSTLIYYIHSWFPPIRIHTAWRLMVQNVIKLPPAQAPLGLSITFRIKNTTWPGLDLLLQPHFTPCSRLLSLPWSEAVSSSRARAAPPPYQNLYTSCSLCQESPSLSSSFVHFPSHHTQLKWHSTVFSDSPDA